MSHLPLVRIHTCMAKPLVQHKENDTLTALAAMQRRGGRKGTDIVGIARMPLNRIPIHDDEAIAAAAEQQAVTN